MNTMLAAAAASVTAGDLLGFTTIGFLVCFAGWTLWAYHPKRRTMMDECANMPLEDE